MSKFKLSIGHLLVLLASACGLKGQTFNEMVDSIIDASVPLIYPDSLHELLKGGSGVVLLDAREPAEFKVSHLPEAKNVGYKNFDVSTLRLSKDTKIIVYCSVGYRSEKIGEKLQDAGFRYVSNLHGGIFGWKNSGYEVVDQSGNQTENVHAYSSSWGKWLVKGRRIYD